MYGYQNRRPNRRRRNPMPVIDVDKARAWAKERWPSPVVRRQVDFLLAHCPRAKEIPVIHCERCKHACPVAVKVGDDATVAISIPTSLYVCTRGHGEEFQGKTTVWADSTCDDAEEREE